MEKQKSATHHLLKARQSKNDEFYTLYRDIHKELQHYDKSLFHNKTIFLNCDDYRKSQFYQYFKDNFAEYKLKEVHAIHKNLGDKQPVYHARLTLDNKNNLREFITDVRDLTDGDFREDYSIRVLQQSDMVITNPPFSLVRDFISTMNNFHKPFLIIASQNTVTYKEVYPLITDDTIRTGVNSGTMAFLMPVEYKDNKNVYLDENDNRYYQRLGNIIWLTTFKTKNKRDKLTLTESYEKNPELFPQYYNLDAIEVSKVADIPNDYGGLMGVPITYLNKHNPEQFKVLGHARAEQFIKETPRLKQYRHNKYTGTTVSTKGDLYRPLLPKEKQPMLTYQDEDGNKYRRVYSRYIIQRV